MREKQRAIKEGIVRKSRRVNEDLPDYSSIPTLS